jgi:16S rRNA (guanine966-N2)-methyltransferase
VTVGAGAWKGRRLRYPDDMRPTMQRTRASFFSSLGDRLAGSRFVDLYAGGGGVGIEALSRGARRVDFVETRRDALACLRVNLEACGVDDDRFRIHAGAVSEFIARVPCPFDDATVMFADPPYDADVNADLLAHFSPAAFPSLEVLVIEHRARFALAPPPGLSVERERRFGDTMLTYFVPAPDPARGKVESGP